MSDKQGDNEQVGNSFGQSVDTFTSGGYASNTSALVEIPETDPTVIAIKARLETDVTALALQGVEKKERMQALSPAEQEKVGPQLMEVFPNYMKKTGFDVRMMQVSGAGNVMDDAKKKMENVKDANNIGDALGAGLEASLGVMGGGMLAMMLPMMFMSFLGELVEKPKEIMAKTSEFHFYKLGVDMIAVDFWAKTEGEESKPSAIGSVVYRTGTSGELSLVDPFEDVKV